MEIWLIRNGERSGPYPDYDIRSRIQHEELDAETRVWHEGLAGWTELGQLDLFRDEFVGRSAAPAPPELPQGYLERASATKAKSKSPQPYFGRRFWARWMDLSVYSAVWWLGMYVGGREIGEAIRNPWMLLSMYVPWFMLEAWLIHRFGTTPGKWLLGLKVRNDDESSLSLKASIWRSTRVMVTGIGFGWGLLSILCQGMSWFTTKRIGRPIWDYLGNHKVIGTSLNPFKIAAVVFLFVGAAQLQMAVKGPHEEKIVSETYPQFKEFFEQADKWYFPVKK